MTTDTTGMNWIWRRCNITNMAIDRNAELLVMVNAVAAVISLTLGGVMALLIALTRWEAVHLLPFDWFYRLVGAHGAAMLIFWILFFEIAALVFGCSIVLSRKLTFPKLQWAAFVMMVIGAIIILVTMISGYATVMFTAYPPLQAETSWFYFGMILFAVGALVAVINFIINLIHARWIGQVQTLPLFVFGLLVAAILAIWTLLSGAAALVPAWLWSIGILGQPDPGVYRMFFWGFGHGAQQINLAAMVAVWYALAALTIGARPPNEWVSRFAFILIVLFIQMGAMHHIAVDPGLGNLTRSFNMSYFIYGATLGSMIHAFTIPAGIEIAQRRRGLTRSLFEWIRKAPWGEVGFSSLVLSFWLFGVMGGISGIIMGTIQTNMIQHNTLIVPAHFHMTVVAGTTLAFMGISYYLVPLIFRRDHVFPGMMKWQPWIYAAGMTIWGLGTGLAGHSGLARRHWDTEFGGNPLGTDVFQTGEISAMLAVLGIGAIIAVTGGAMFVVDTVATVFLGRKVETPNLPGIHSDALGDSRSDQAAGIQPAPHHSSGFEAPGTLILVFLFLLLFVFLYGFSWYELSEVNWIIR